MALARTIKLNENLVLEIDAKNQEARVKSTKADDEKNVAALAALNADRVINEFTRVVALSDKSFIVITQKALHKFSIESTTPVKVNLEKSSPLLFGKFFGLHAHCAEGRFIFGASLSKSEGDLVQETWVYDLNSSNVSYGKIFDENTWLKQCVFVDPELLALIKVDKTEYYAVSEKDLKYKGATEHWGDYQDVVKMFELFAHCKPEALKLFTAEYERLQKQLIKTKNAGAREKITAHIKALTDLADLLKKDHSYHACIEALNGAARGKLLLGGKIPEPFPDLKRFFRALGGLEGLENVAQVKRELA